MVEQSIMNNQNEDRIIELIGYDIMRLSNNMGT